MDQWFYEKYILTTHMRHRRKYKLQSNVSLMIKPECRDVYQGSLLSCSSLRSQSEQRIPVFKKNMCFTAYGSTRGGTESLWCNPISILWWIHEIIKNRIVRPLLFHLFSHLIPSDSMQQSFPKILSSSRGSKFNINYKF